MAACNIVEWFFFVVGVFLQWILEVAGCGGAIWGMSEVWQLRGYGTDDPLHTNHDWRFPANTFFSLGFIRFLFRYVPETGYAQALVSPHAWFHDMKTSESSIVNTNIDLPQSYSAEGILSIEGLFFLAGVMFVFILEVAGAGGAWWGMSEVWQLRGYGNQDPPGSNDRFRWVANIVFSIAAIRMIQKFLPDHAINTAMTSPHAWIPKGTAKLQQEAWFALWGMFLQFILECAGCGGATWGMSEVWQMRGYGTDDPPKTNDQFRYVANIAFAFSLIRIAQKYCPDAGIHEAMTAPQAWLRAKLDNKPSRDQANSANDRIDL